MNYKRHSSADFGSTSSAIGVEMPEQLIHRDVEGFAETDFSRQRQHAVSIVKLPARTMSMTLGGLDPLQSTSRHRHAYETLIFIVEGIGTTVIEDRRIEWMRGDALYIPVWAWHHHQNRSRENRCLYVACENAPLLQNLGGLALREEESPR